MSQVRNKLLTNSMNLVDTMRLAAMLFQQDCMYNHDIQYDNAIKLVTTSTEQTARMFAHNILVGPFVFIEFKHMFRSFYSIGKNSRFYM